MTYILAQLIRGMLEIYETAEMWILFICVMVTVDFSKTYREIDGIYEPGYRE